jgi:cardiolipin synthase
VAAVTDLLDGWIARRAHVSTRWGRLYDPFMDGIFFGVAAISLAVIGVLPQWIAALVVFRYALPVVGAIAFLFTRRRTPRIRHTPWGRASSASIAATIFLAGAAAGLGLPFDRLGPILYAIVVVAAVGALLNILMRGIEQV